MPDPSLRSAVREALDLQMEEPLTEGVMKRLTKLVASNKGIASIEGLQHATHLDFLQLSGTSISDLQYLQDCVLLTSLNLHACGAIKDIRPLRNKVSGRRGFAVYSPKCDLHS